MLVVRTNATAHTDGAFYERVWDRTHRSILTSADGVWEDGAHYDIWRVTARAGQRVAVQMNSDDLDAY